MWSTYIGEAIQSGNHRKYSMEHNLSYSTINDKSKLYRQLSDTQNWSSISSRRYSHRMFTDSTEKQAVEQFIEPFINEQKACNNSDCLLKMYNNKNDVNKCLFVSDSTMARIKQQYKLNTVRARCKSYNMKHMMNCIRLYMK